MDMEVKKFRLLRVWYEVAPPLGEAEFIDIDITHCINEAEKKGFDVEKVFDKLSFITYEEMERYDNSSMM